MRRIAAIGILALMSNTAGAQSFFLRAGAGYAFPNAGQTLSINGLPYSGSAAFTQANGFTSYEMKSASLASGAQAVIGACYLFNSNFGIEVDANIMFAPNKLESRNQYETANNDNVDQRSTYYARNPIVLHPALYMQTSWGKLGMYGRGGLAIPVGTRIVREDIAVITAAGGGATENYNITQEFTTNTAIGFSGAFGLKYTIAPYINLWAEGNLQSMSLYVKEAEYTEYIIDRQSFLSQLPQQVRTTRYGKSRSNSTEPTFSFPFSSMGINAGVSFDF